MSRFDRSILAQNLVRLRHESHRNRTQSQLQVAKAVGVSKSTISSLERGKGKVVNFELISQLALYFGVKPKDLVGDPELRGELDPAMLPELYEYLPEKDRRTIAYMCQDAIELAYGNDIDRK